MIGIGGHFGIGRETTWGTAVAATDYIEILSEDLTTTRERYEIVNITGGLYEPDDKAGTARHEGTVVFAAHPVTVGHILEGALGSATATSVAANFYSIAFKAATTNTSTLNPLPSYTLEIFRPGAGLAISTSFRYSGVQFNGFSINMAPNQDWRVTANVIAKDQTFVAKTTPSFPSSSDCPFAFDTTSLQIAGAADVNVEALTIDWANNLEGMPGLAATADVVRIRRTNAQQVRLSGTLEFQDHTRFTEFTNQSEQALVVSASIPDSFELLFDVPRMVFNEMPVALSGRDRVLVNFAGIGRWKVSSASALEVTLTTINTF